MLPELLVGPVAGVVNLGLGPDELIQQLACAVLPASLGVGLGHRERLAERASTLGGEDGQAGQRRSLAHGLPVFRGEVCLGRHGLFLGSVAAPAALSAV